MSKLNKWKRIWDATWREAAGRPGNMKDNLCFLHIKDKSLLGEFSACLCGQKKYTVETGEGVIRKSRRFLEDAKYVWTDGELPEDFVKQEGQTVVLLWSKAACNALAAGMEGRRLCADHTLRTIMNADYICVPDEETWENIGRIYKTGGLYRGWVLVNRAAEEICSLILHDGHNSSDNSGDIWVQGNGKTNVVIYAGNLDQQGITTAFASMMESLDRSRHNYYIAFRRKEISGFPQRLDRLPRDTGLIPLLPEAPKGIVTLVAQRLYLNRGKRYGWIQKRISDRYKREWKRQFGTVHFDRAVQYCGYETYMIFLFQAAPCENMIWVHNDMEQEIRLRHNQNPHLLKDAYCSYDHVVVVSEDIRESTGRISGKIENIQVIGNCHDDERVKRRAQEEVRFDKDTESNVTLEELKAILDKDTDRFINIGRYSPEKGHKRLLEAFSKYWEEHRDTYLIIIGGGGDLYEETKRFAGTQKAADHIVLLKTMSNPMPVLNKCSLFLLSSYYEGLGLVLLEADTLGVPVMACDVNGPRGFLKKFGGILLENTEQGLLEGMRRYSRGEAHPMHVDYEKLNREYMEKCEALFDGKSAQLKGRD